MMYCDSSSVEYLMDVVPDLALVTKGNTRITKVHITIIPHCFVNNGGFALRLLGYMLATAETCVSASQICHRGCHSIQWSSHTYCLALYRSDSIPATIVPDKRN